MLRQLLPITALLSSVALLLAGSGLLGTLLAVRGRTEGFSDQVIGLVMSAYFVGFFLGTFLAPPLIRRIGHIRGFAFFAALAASAALLHPIWLHPGVWMALRLATGIAMVGLCTVIESWLNTEASAEYRSRVFAVYMVVSLLALAFGQLLLDLAPPRDFMLFSVAAILVSLASLPVTATRLSPPPLMQAPSFHPGRVFAVAPTAAIGAMVAGLVLGGFWGMGPVFAERSGLDRAGVGMFMGLAVAGGAFLQLPIGRLSDRGDRRTTLALVSTLGALVAGAIGLLPADARTLLVGITVLGGLVFTLYPLCVSHLLEHLSRDELLGGCSALLLYNGVGAALGPALAGALMARFGPLALPALFCSALALLAAIAGGRRLLRARHLLNPTRFHPMLRTTPTVLELLPEIPDAPRKDEHHERHA